LIENLVEPCYWQVNNLLAIIIDHNKISTFQHGAKFPLQDMIIDCPFGGTTRMCNKKYGDATWCNNLMWGHIVSIS
jgi:hypothetical protein